MTTEKLTDDEVKAIIVAGLEEAARFTRAYIEQNGQHFPCGFAWVNIKPARGQFVRVLNEMKVGSTDESMGGCTVWNPSGNGTQCMDAKEVGARAFAEHLRKYELNASSHTRMD